MTSSVQGRAPRSLPHAEAEGQAASAVLSMQELAARRERNARRLPPVEAWVTIAGFLDRASRANLRKVCSLLHHAGRVAEKSFTVSDAEQLRTVLELFRVGGIEHMTLDGGEGSEGFTDADRAHLPDCLQSLNVVNADWFNDAWMERLASFGNLRVLHLTGCPEVTAEGGRHIRALALQELSLVDCWRISEDFVHSLDRMPSLRMLDVTASRCVSNALVREAAALPGLRVLCLNECGDVADEGIAHLAGTRLEELEMMYLHQLTDDGVAQLENVQLRRLDLTSTAVTDNCLPTLARMSKLEEVGLEDTNVTPEAIAALQAERPGLRIQA